MYEEFIKTAEKLVFREDKPEKSDIIFIPGNGYPQMAERAAELYREGYASLLLPSGKYSVTEGAFSGVLSKRGEYSGCYETEWEFLKEVLVKNGVPRCAVLREDQATFTYENAIYSRQVTDGAGMEIKRAILCCKAYHAGRALMYYQLLYPKTVFFVCPASPDGITRQNWRESDAGVEAVTGEIARIIRQFTRMLERP